MKWTKQVLNEKNGSFSLTHKPSEVGVVTMEAFSITFLQRCCVFLEASVLMRNLVSELFAFIGKFLL